MKTPTKVIKKLQKKIAEKKPKGFQKGNQLAKGKGTPKGSTNYNREELIARKIDNVVIVNYITLNSHLNLEQLKERRNDPNTTALERMIITNMILAAQGADVQRMNFILDRLVGKAVQPIELSKKDPLKDLSHEELLEMKKELEITNRQSMKLLEQTNPRVQEQLNNYERQLEQLRNSEKEPSETN